ncbi:tRNA (adenosine(37)-N6)-threonylcarbamoyltransferase complex ATPase subunit type 1 TsaE [Patescibacteria group bacterium]|nr:tRNA (adenosine(37)-N6)-threonylcarbamoyltransferase complex ATPase subunit type 1 TsaE [Patescibacteria group bacterium]
MNYISQNPTETHNLANQLLKQFPHLSIWLIYGDLAAGKTTLVKGLGDSLNINPKKIKSPTFTLVSEFPNLIHYDLYRLSELDETLQSQIEEHLKSPKLTVIEWPELIEEQVESPHLKIRIAHLGKDQREFIIEEY